WTWQVSVPTSGLMHSDHRHPGCKVIRAALTEPRSTTSTWLLSGVRRSSGVSKLFDEIPTISTSPVRDPPIVRAALPRTETGTRPDEPEGHRRLTAPSGTRARLLVALTGALSRCASVPTSRPFPCA